MTPPKHLADRSLSGKCLPAQDITSLWKEGRISGELDADRVQPSSFEPVLSEEAYWIRMQGTGGFRLRKGQTVTDALNALAQGSVQQLDISEGHVIRPNETWLVRLKDSITVRKGEYIKASPKSSIGRCFLFVRLIADKHTSFDELTGEDTLAAKHDTHTQLWVLLQPLTFSHVIAPDIPVLQLRWFTGKDARLTDTELETLFAQDTPLLSADDPVIMEGLQVHLDLVGEESHSIVGLRARPNPNPIDLRKTGMLNPEDYFDPITKENGSYVMRQGEHCLFLTKEQLITPPYLNMELRAHWGGSFAGPKHFAGFIDNGFSRRLVLEVRSDEIDDIELVDGMPIGKIDVYWTGETDKVYGADIGSNYAQQVGPQPSKHFMSVDWSALQRRG